MHAALRRDVQIDVATAVPRRGDPGRNHHGNQGSSGLVGLHRSEGLVADGDLDAGTRAGLHHRVALTPQRDGDVRGLGTALRPGDCREDRDLRNGLVRWRVLRRVGSVGLPDGLADRTRARGQPQARSPLRDLDGHASSRTRSELEVGRIRRDVQSEREKRDQGDRLLFHRIARSLMRAGSATQGTSLVFERPLAS